MNLIPMYPMFILAITIWREARGESPEGRRAVMWVILNRVRAKFMGTSIVDVCTRKWQFSAMTAPTDPGTTTWPSGTNSADWQAFGEIAEMIKDYGTDPTNGAVNYYAKSIPPPAWAKVLPPEFEFTVEIGNHRFYRKI